MKDAGELLHELTKDSKDLFKERQVIMSFGGFIERVMNNPQNLIRNASQYLFDTFNYFGKSSQKTNNQHDRWSIFDIGTEKNVPIIGTEGVQNEIYKALTAFNRQGLANRLILLHGPNGSAKTSIIESLSRAMNEYSLTDDGAVYRFNWIFPTEKSLTSKAMGSSGPIGFGKEEDKETSFMDTFAFLEESKISSKIHSEFKENPIFLIPMPQRENWLKSWVANQTGCKPEEVDLPKHILMPGLSKRNQLIFENLLAAYDGDLAKVFRHVQVERFFFSKQYRVGVGTVEPQMSIDAAERQLTMDQSIANLPPVLGNISFHEAAGPIVEANRGILEFSDMLKRPIEAFKYLLSTVEKGTLNLPSSTANLDIVFFASTNEKHLDAFKTIPDFASFRSRFELVTAPYLLESRLEEKIYTQDIKAIAEDKKVAPHSLRLLCLWAVMTRLQPPNPEHYNSRYRSLISRIDPYSKIKLYENKSLDPIFKPEESNLIYELRESIMEEYENTIIYEGRFGASPREIRNILYRAAQNKNHSTLTPMAIFEELERLIKDHSQYEFLQIESRGKYHNPSDFIKTIKEDFVEKFENEVTYSMTLVEEKQHDTLLKRYINHAVAQVKKESIYNKMTGGYDQPSETLLTDIEKILGIGGSAQQHRESILSRIAAYKIDNPEKDIIITEIFHDYGKKLKDHYFNEHRKLVNKNYKVMLSLGTDKEQDQTAGDLELAETTFKNLEERYGYDRSSATESLKFLMSMRPDKE